MVDRSAHTLTQNRNARVETPRRSTDASAGGPLHRRNGDAGVRPFDSERVRSSARSVRLSGFLSTSVGAP